MIGTGNVKAPLAPTLRLLAPLLRSTRPPPARPDTVPPMVGSTTGVTQVIATFVTSAAAIVPAPLPTLQVWPLGWVRIVTL